MRYIAADGYWSVTFSDREIDDLERVWEESKNPAELYWCVQDLLDALDVPYSNDDVSFIVEAIEDGYEDPEE